MARTKSRLNAALTAKICAHIRKAAPLVHAAGAEGVPKSTINDWNRRGLEPGAKDPYKHFAKELAKARSSLVTKATSTIYKAGEKNPNHLMWLLKHLDRENFGEELRIVARREATTDVLDRLREGLDPEAFGRVVALLVGDDGPPVPDPREGLH